MIFIVAKDHFQAAQAAEANGLVNEASDRVQWKYLFAGYRLNGFAKPQVWLCPRWEEGKSMEEVDCFYKNFDLRHARTVTLTHALELPHAD